MGPLAELFVHGGNGFLVAAGDVSVLFDVLRNIAKELEILEQSKFKSIVSMISVEDHIEKKSKSITKQCE